MAKPFSVDLRERILKTYDEGKSNREEVAKRYRVSLGMVKKLIQQRRHSGDIKPRYDRCGRKPKILGLHQRQMRTLLAKKPDLTLEELRKATALECTLPAIHYVLVRMGLSYKKRRFEQASRTAAMLPKSEGSGAGNKAGSTRHGLSSSTKVRPKRT
jgi:transposase